jgi:subfamily B ATP-binding cassette protein MsbA
MSRRHREKDDPPADVWGTYRRLLRYVRPYLPRLIAGFVFGGLYAASQGAFVAVIKGGFARVFKPSDMSVGAVFLLSLSFPLIAAIRGAADYLATYCVKWVGNRVIMDLRNAMFSHLHSLSVSYFSRSRTGELIARTANDTSLVERVVSTVIGDMAKEPLTLVAMIGWVFYTDARLALVSFVLFPLCIVPVALFGRRVRRHAREAQARIADVISILQETVSGVRIVKAFGMEKYETDRFMSQTKAFFSRRMRVERSSTVVEPIIVVIAAAGAALVLTYVRIVQMPLENFVAFVTALFLMYDPVKKLSRLHLLVQQSSAAADRVFEVLDTPSTVADRPGARDFAGPILSIRFEDVHFAYDDKPVLQGIELDVRAGERIALVGSSGAGKTSLVNLLPRFYDVTQGRIALNGTDIRDLTLVSLRRLCGLVTQETFLFNDTVANNIAYGTTAASRDQIVAAARDAYAHEFIQEMPEGYDTVIGERGVRLSGGQRQRLAIARAILRNPPILILDEATSALDTESERMVQAALDQLMRGRTVFAIAHRLSTIVHCDRILVLDGGRIVEQGAHAGLLAANGVYRRLYDLQFGMAAAAAASEAGEAPVAAESAP